MRLQKEQEEEGEEEEEEEGQERDEEGQGEEEKEKREEALRGFLLYGPLRCCRKYGHSHIHVAGSKQSTAPQKEVWEVSTAEV